MHNIVSVILAWLKKPLVVYPLLLLGVVAFSGFSELRPLWYDEALTVMEFASLSEFSRVYFAYVIANNHIVYTLLLKFWLHGTEGFFPVSEFTARLFSLLISSSGMFLLWHYFRARFGMRTALVMVAVVLTSMPFPIYAAAVRGYALSLLLAVLSLLVLDRAMLAAKNRFLYWGGYFLCAFLMVGTLPSNLLYFVALSCMRFPANFSVRRIRRWLPVAVLPPVAFLIFYFPIRFRLFDVLSHTHGWPRPVPAIADFYLPLLAAGLPLLPAIVCGFLAMRNRQFSFGFGTSWVRVAGFAVPWLIPAAMMLLRNPSPFPRVFLVFAPLYLIQGAQLVRMSFAAFRTFRGRRSVDFWMFLTLGLVVFCNVALLLMRPVIANAVVPADAQDDMIQPYYARDFDPRSLVFEIRKRLASSGPFAVLIGGSSDPPSILFSGNLIGIPPHIWIYDRPKERVPDDLMVGMAVPLLVVAKDHEELASLQQRFRIRDVELIGDFGFQKLYVAGP